MPVDDQAVGRDRAFARLLVATALRRLGQVDALIALCLSTPLAPRAAVVHDILRLGVAQLLFCGPGACGGGDQRRPRAQPGLSLA